LNKLENDDGDKISELEAELKTLQLEEERLVEDLKKIREHQAQADADLQVSFPTVFSFCLLLS